MPFSTQNIATKNRLSNTTNLYIKMKTKNTNTMIEKVRKYIYTNRLIESAQKIKKEEDIKNINRFFKLSLDMNCIIDLNGYFKEISSSFESILGYSREELVAKPYKHFMVDEDYYKTEAEFDRLIEGNLTQHFENRYICKNGSIRWFAWRAHVSATSNLIYCIARDITEQKKRDQKLKDYSEQLEVAIEENLGSLRYARLLQEAILQNPDQLNQIFPQSFIYNSPKNIVSGDFYWFEKNGSIATLACADCTGHGIPGAMLSIMGMNKLHEINRLELALSPAKVLDMLSMEIHNALSEKNGTKIVNDGMDMALCSLDYNTNILEYAGANNSLYIIREGILHKLAADKKCIGASLDQGVFENKTFEVQTGDMVYVFSDGYVDQFGGDKNKKYGFKRFTELLLSICNLNPIEQNEILKNTIETWRQDNEQTDDILVIGIKI